ncbi:MAG: prepilin peptidase [Chloroflexi bacterium]|nr:prepilin peptidase [Chloroflexota bacterium]
MLWPCWVALGLVLGSLINWVADHLAQHYLSQTDSPSKTTAAPRLDITSLRVIWLWMQRSTDFRAIPRLQRRLLVELTIIAVCVYLWRQFGASPEFVALLAYAGLFSVIFVVDAETGFVPNLVLGAGAIIALTLRLAYSALPVSSALLGAVVGFTLFLPLALIRKGVMGAGDIKLAGLIGLVVGFPGVITALAMGVVLGGLGALILMLSGAKRRHDYMPYAPYLAVGCMVTLLRGAAIF